MPTKVDCLQQLGRALVDLAGKASGVARTTADCGAVFGKLDPTVIASELDVHARAWIDSGASVRFDGIVYILTRPGQPSLRFVLDGANLRTTSEIGGFCE